MTQRESLAVLESIERSMAEAIQRMSRIIEDIEAKAKEENR